MNSMTGYAYNEVQTENAVVSVEIKSVNSRFLDLTINLPSYLNSLESFFRSKITEKVSRGKVDVYIKIKELSSVNDFDVDMNMIAALGKIYSKAFDALCNQNFIVSNLRSEEKIFSLAKTDSEVKAFLDNLKSNDAYQWRIIEGTNRKSFHSLGIALDVLPKSQGGKQIFWSWAKDKYPDTWMLVPLKNRWMPPLSVIKAFEEEGFIWGGKWVIYDNMHFEYHPELIEFNYRK